MTLKWWVDVGIGRPESTSLVYFWNIVKENKSRLFRSTTASHKSFQLERICTKIGFDWERPITAVEDALQKGKKLINFWMFLT